jgi:hypothetical protein
MRADLYGPVHKGLRSVLFDLSVELARSDFANAGEAEVALSACKRAVDFLRVHHEHEETLAQPMLASRAPDVVAATHAQHETIDVAIAELEAIAREVGRADGAARAAAGQRLVGAYDRFLVDYLAHMRHEETAMQEAFWRHFTDEELGALQVKIQGAIPPARLAEFLAIMLPAMNFGERARVLGVMKANAPEPAFRAAKDVAARVLGQSAWDALRAQAQL